MHLSESVTDPRYLRIAEYIRRFRLPDTRKYRYKISSLLDQLDRCDSDLERVLIIGGKARMPQKRGNGR